jgi:hypothetical protein
LPLKQLFYPSNWLFKKNFFIIPMDIRSTILAVKISGSTRSDTGRKCRDTFTSLKKTCRKLGISFWDYLKDRMANINAIPPLPDLIRSSSFV